MCIHVMLSKLYDLYIFTANSSLCHTGINLNSKTNHSRNKKYTSVAKINELLIPGLVQVKISFVVRAQA